MFTQITSLMLLGAAANLSYAKTRGYLVERSRRLAIESEQLA